MVILITGASRGIGRALTRHYLSQGDTVVAVARDQDALTRLLADSESTSGVLHVYAADVTDAARMEQVVGDVQTKIGPLDIVIANAGIGDHRLRSDLDPLRVQRVFATNTLGVVNTFAPAIQTMCARGRGQLVAISSLSAIQSIPRISSYGASKAALNHQLESLYWDLKPHGIDVTTICPGFIDTDMLAGQGIGGIWLMSQSVATRKIVAAIAKRGRVHYFPRWLYVCLRGLAVMPDAIKGLVLGRVVEWMFPRRASTGTGVDGVHQSTRPS